MEEDGHVKRSYINFDISSVLQCPNLLSFFVKIPRSVARRKKFKKECSMGWGGDGKMEHLI